MSRNDVTTVAPAPAEVVQVVERRDEMPLEQAPANPLLVMHSLLRGRYWLAILLGIIGLVGGIAGGYFVKPVTYRSVGMVRVKPILPRVLYQNEQNGVMPMFDAFVESQVALIQGQRVIDNAMQAPDWRGLNRPLDPKQIATFTESLEVQHPRGSEMITVSFVDRDPEAAMKAVKSVIEAYDKLYGENDADSDAQILQTLEDRRTALTNELKAKNDRILTIGNEFGSDSLEQIYDFKLAELQKLESQMKETQRSLAAAEARAESAQASATTQPIELTPEVLAASVPLMQKYLNERRELERQIEINKLTLGENHRTMIQARTLMASLQKEIDELTDIYRKAEHAGATVDRVNAAGAAMPSVAELKASVAKISELYESAKAETIALGQKRMQISAIRTEADTVKQRLKETEARIEQLNVESPVRGRISVVSWGDRPLQPFNDKRIAFSAVGGLGGAGLGVGIVLLIGFMDRRMRHVADVQSRNATLGRLLGVLPILPDDVHDPEQALVAAQSVHHIRAMLQARSTPGTCQSIAITSACAGAGKTSLALALGLSFAASGSKTLLVDCDMVGGGLTRRMARGSQRRLGRVLRRIGLMDTSTVHQVVEIARQQHARFGETAVKEGHISQEQLDRALAIQGECPLGLKEVLAGDSLTECVAGAGLSKLYVLPLGGAVRQHIGQLSQQAISRILSQAAEHFNIIIIDTGPVLGSLEASIVTMAVDQVIVAVSRGEDRALTDRALRDLNENGAHVAGVVFNRAQPADMLASGYSSSGSLASLGRSSGGKLAPSVIETYSRLGPLAVAVGASTEVGESN